MHILSKISLCLLCLGIVCTSIARVPSSSKSTLSAKDQQTATQLYEFPSKQAPIVEQISPQRAITPFFTKKGWVKVADPQTGKVGWIEESRLAVQLQRHISFDIKSKTLSISEQQPTRSGYYQVTLQNQPKPISNQEAQAMFKRIEKQQQAMQKAMEKMQQEIFGQVQHGLSSIRSTPPHPVLSEEKDKQAFQGKPTKEQGSDDLFHKIGSKIKSMF